ncbi:MAG: hypothetical protein Q8R37_06170 [Nanoarchaeota archaeon]|nr:hypothetical protein [Nanoarchaeota archaeon]
MATTTTTAVQRIFAWIVLLLLFNLPLATALEFANVDASAVTDDSAVVQWQTDQPANSFVYYGVDKQNLQSTGDANLVTTHQLPLTNLNADATYFYKVESGGETDDNDGNLYSFTTLQQDTEAPDLDLDMPAVAAGREFMITGTTEAGATVTMKVNSIIQKVTTADSAGVFSSIVLLEGNEDNVIKVEVSDASGNSVFKEWTIFADVTKPTLSLQDFPHYLTERSLELKGTISEESSFEIFVNNRSAAKGTGKEIDARISFTEGKNTLEIVLTDLAGLQTTETFTIDVDSQAPTVRAEIAKGYEYYEGRASSSISGTTKPGAKVYLYVYKPLSYEFKPDFRKAREIITAAENGEFTFEDVDFASSFTDISLEDIAPREIPSGLNDYTIAALRDEASQQQFTYNVILIAEDRSGRTAFWQHAVTVNSCLSTDFAFAVSSVPEFQAPFRLVPQLLDQGRQDIQAVFKLDYQGTGVSKEEQGGAEIEPAFRINTMRIEKACTQSQLDDDKFGLGCKILPRSSQKIENGDRTSVYATWILGSSEELSKREEKFWDDFKKRQIVFPLKITVQYQEREGTGQYSTPKTQTSCVDLGYFVDIPIESKELLPDFLAEDGVKALNKTITLIQDVKPYLEKAYLVAGVSCMGSFAVRLVARWARIFVSKSEPILSKVEEVAGSAGGSSDEEKKEACPKDQNGLYLESTLENWKELIDNNLDHKLPSTIVEALKTEQGTKKITLDEVCPSTASAWKFEAGFDAAYRWTCDRAFCRAVPAGWTETKELAEINSVIVQQQQCAVTGRGVPLMERENCQELIKKNIVNIDPVLEDTGTCWQTVDGTTYRHIQPTDPQEIEDTKQGVFLLTPIGTNLGPLVAASNRLLVYKPQGAESYVVGKDQFCKNVCDDKPGYVYDDAGSVDGKGCYDEKLVGGNPQLFGKITADTKDGRLNEKDKYSAGYTRDCFIKKEDGSRKLIRNLAGEPQFQQCVCTTTTKPIANKLGAREAIAENEAGVGEDWSYQQDRLFVESGGTAGTYYPKIRYYTGRDLSGAFGADYLLDYLSAGNDVHEVNPHTQFIGTWQSVCLSGMLKHLTLLESILQGLRNCLVEAKHTGLQDAGMCKTLFTQHVCGLIYKAIGYLNTQCSPINFDDVDKEGLFGDVGAIVSQGFNAIPAALQSSIDDVQSDYGNAQLNQYFRNGAQGFAQSMCLAAFGYDVPLFSTDFLLDAAYSFPVKTSVVLVPRERELSTYNPALQTAVFNYNIGGVILPGCKVRNYRLSLKCIGPEDRGHPGLDETCNGQGCDCLNREGTGAFEGQREKVLKSGFGLTSGQMFSIPLESPQRVDSHFRYDHVKVELFLDSAESGNADKCFDQGFFDGNKGIFYEPLIDVSPPITLSCSASLVNGEYQCPQLAGTFGFGGASLEEPFVSCWNKKIEQWTECSSPNLFVKGDEIKVRAHVNLDDKGKCLKRTVRGVPGIDPESPPRLLQENSPGLQTVPEVLGIVDEAMFGGAVNTIRKIGGNSECQEPAYTGNPESVTSGTYSFKFIRVTDDTVRLIVPAGAIPLGEYSSDSQNNNYLTSGGANAFTISQINDVEFDIYGFKVKNVLGNVKATDSDNLCTFGVVSGTAAATSSNFQNIFITYELFERDEAGGCNYLTPRVKTTAGKRAIATKTIRIQREETAFQEISGLHDSFNKKNYEQAASLADQIIRQKNGDVTDAVAIYYYIASLIKKGDKEKDVTRYQIQINNLLTLFFTRNLSGQRSADYTPETKQAPEYQKINAYLCEVDRNNNGPYHQDSTMCKP